MKCWGSELDIRYWVLGIVVVVLVVGCDGPVTPTPTPTDSPVATPTPMSPLPTPTVEPVVGARVEAEEAALAGDWQVAYFDQASACYAVHTLDEGRLDEGNPSDGLSGTATYQLTIGEAGEYAVWGRVYGADLLDNSFYVTIDGGTRVTWHFPHGHAWRWDRVSDWDYDLDVEVPLTYTLAAGEHEVVVEPREDGGRLDVLEIVVADSAPSGEVEWCSIAPSTPTPESQAAGQFWVDYAQTVTVYHTGVTTPTLFWAVKLLDGDGGLVYSATLDTGVEGPVVTGTGKFDGTFFFDYPLFDGTAAEWAKCWWASDEMYVIDGEALRLVDRIDCEFEGETQDGEGYWFVREVEGLEHRVYLPVAMRAGE